MSGVLERLQEHIRESGPNGSEVVILCSPTNHYPSTYGDKNWGCGYRNLQMLLSALIKIEGYKNTVSKGIQFTSATCRYTGFIHFSDKD